MKITITRGHHSTKTLATTILKRASVVELIKSNLPRGIRLSNVKTSWQDNLMSFSLRAGIGIVSGTIQGTLAVKKKVILINLEIPDIVNLFFSKDIIEKGITEQLTDLFPEQV